MRLLIVFLLISTSALCQIPATDWQFTLNVEAYDRIDNLIETSDNNILIIGRSATSFGETMDYYTPVVKKISSSGASQWSRSFTTEYFQVSPRLVKPIELLNGSGYIVQSTRSRLTKLDLNGNVIKSLDIEDNGDVVDLVGVVQLQTGVIGVLTEDYVSATNLNYRLTTYDADLIFISTYSIGGSTNEVPTDITVGLDGNHFVLAGNSNAGGPVQGWIVAVNTSGDILCDYTTTGSTVERILTHPSKIHNTISDVNNAHDIVKSTNPYTRPSNWQDYLFIGKKSGVSWIGAGSLNDWNLPPTTTTTSGTIQSVTFTPDGRPVMTTSDSVVMLENRLKRIWKTTDQKNQRIEITKKGEYLIYGGNDFRLVKTRPPVLNASQVFRFMGQSSDAAYEELGHGYKRMFASFIDLNQNEQIDLDFHGISIRWISGDEIEYYYYTMHGYLTNAGGSFDKTLAKSAYFYNGTTRQADNFSLNDFDNDGNLEVFNNKINNISASTGELTLQTSNFPLLSNDNQSDISWGDFDNNGLKDAFVNLDAIYAQGPANTFTRLTATSSFAGSISSPILVDINTDGFLDFIDRNEKAIYLNLDGTTFAKQGTLMTHSPKFAVELNGDGRIDFIALSGTTYYTCLNNGNLTFTYAPLNLNLPQPAGDINNDGRTDLVAVLAKGYAVYFNNGSGVFPSQTNYDYVVPHSYSDYPFTIYAPSFIIVPGNIDNDGDLDLAAIDGFQAVIMKNGQTTSNQKPSAPSNLRSTRASNTTTLEWNASTDDTTPAAALNYNVYIKNGAQIIASANSLANGKRTLVDEGNAHLSKIFKITGLPVGTYQWSVQAIDKGFEPSSFSTEQIFYITNNPTNLSLSAATIPENSTTAIGSFTTTDPDAGETFTYSLVSGTGSTDNTLFEITGTSIHAESPGPGLNFETKASYSIRVRTTDSRQGTFEKVFTITATNVQEGATDIALSVGTIQENKPINTVIGTLTSNDPDAGDIHLYTLVAGTGADNNSSFQIVGNQLQSKEIFNFETKASYTIRVQTNDQKGQTFQKIMPISITDVNDTPTNIALTSSSIEEGKPLLTIIGVMSSTDDDSGETFTYSLPAGFGNNNSFVISSTPADNINLTSGEVFTKSIKETYLIKIRTTDSKGSSFEKEFTITILPTSVPLALSDLNYQPQYEMEKSSKTVSAKIQGGKSPYTVELIYKGIGVSPEATLSATLKSNDIYEAVITNAIMDADPFGIEFHIKVTDANGLSKQTDPKLIYKGYTTTSAETIPITKFGGTLGTYQIISIPLELDNKSVANTFGPALGGADKSKWRLIEYKDDQYIDFGGKLVNLELGKGYWFNAREQVTIKTTSGTVAKVTEADPFVMNLTDGWNLIGNPYPFNLDWDDVLDANPDENVGELFVYNQNKQNYDVSNSLQKWAGGFVLSDGPSALDFHVSLKATSSGRKSGGKIVNAELDSESWIVPLTIKAGAAESNFSGIGMHPEADLSKDKYDRVTPPRFTNHLELKSHHADYRFPDFSQDVVPTQSEYIWQFIFSNDFDSPVSQISWSKESLGDNSAQLILHDLENERIVNMKESGSYEFKPTGENHRFKIHFSIHEKDILPEQTKLGSAYPNPLKTQTSIPLRLTSDNTSYHVSIQIFDLMGRQVNSLVNDTLNPGFHEVVWGGNNFRQEDLPNGVYIYQLIINGRNTHQLNRLIIEK